MAKKKRKKKIKRPKRLPKLEYCPKCGVYLRKWQ